MRIKDDPTDELHMIDLKDQTNSIEHTDVSQEETRPELSQSHDTKETYSRNDENSGSALIVVDNNLQDINFNGTVNHNAIVTARRNTNLHDNSSTDYYPKAITYEKKNDFREYNSRGNRTFGTQYTYEDNVSNMTNSEGSSNPASNTVIENNKFAFVNTDGNYAVLSNTVEANNTYSRDASKRRGNGSNIIFRNNKVTIEDTNANVSWLSISKETNNKY